MQQNNNTHAFPVHVLGFNTSAVFFGRYYFVWEQTVHLHIELDSAARKLLNLMDNIN